MNKKTILIWIIYFYHSLVKCFKAVFALSYAQMNFLHFIKVVCLQTAPFFFINHFRPVMISVQFNVRYWCWCRISFFFIDISVGEFTVSVDGRPLLRVTVTSHKVAAVFV